MKHQIDCLLIAYSGWDKKDIYYKILAKKDSRVLGISNPLNSAITYLGTSLKEEGFTFEFVNAVEDEKDHLVHLLQTYEIESIGISTTFVPYEFEKDYGITILASFMIGFPEETKETAEETYRFIEETKPDFYFLNPWFYDSRSPIHDQRDQYELKGSELNWSHKDMDSETAHQIVLEMKNRIKSSIWMIPGWDTFLFQMITNMGLPMVKSIFKETTLQVQEIAKFFQQSGNEGS